MTALIKETVEELEEHEQLKPKFIKTKWESGGKK